MFSAAASFSPSSFSDQKFLHIDPVLFHGTIRLNLDPFQRHSDQELWDVLERSDLKQYIASCSGGLDSDVSEGGENLSVGQRQLLCLARAMLTKARIIVMDEG